jgi:hypothetical protein
MKCAVITATVGRPSLKDCVLSVLSQGPWAQHYVVIDGPQYEQGARHALGELQFHPQVCVSVLDDNVGSHSYNGHRVYAAYPFLVSPSCEFVAFLDDDNTYINGGLSRMRQAMHETQSQWCFCKRRVTDGESVVDDECESVGPDPKRITGDGILIDVNCYLIRKSIACEMGSFWNRPYKMGCGEIDRLIARHLVREFPKFTLSPGSPGVMYRCGSVPGVSVTLDFFEEGNRKAAASAPESPLFVFHFSRDATERYLTQPPRGKRSHSPAHKEWCLTLLDGLAATRSLVNGYDVDIIPSGATCLFCICQPTELPDRVLLRRDVKKVGYLFESPNIRHQAQNDASFLMERFDVIMTYWADLIRLLPPDRVVPCHQFSHCMELNDPWDRALLQQNEDVAGRSVGIVLENRDQRGQFVINETLLSCHDHLRKELTLSFAEAGLRVVGYGPSWLNCPPVVRGTEGQWGRAAGHSIMLLKRQAFSLIVENCDAAGYVSEKILDALVAGCIPLYYGNLRSAQIHIPADMYIDLKSTPDAPQLIATMSDEDLNELRNRIMSRREEVLRQNTPTLFAENVEKAIALAWTDSRDAMGKKVATLGRVDPTVRVNPPPGLDGDMQTLFDAFKSKGQWVGCDYVTFGQAQGQGELVKPSQIWSGDVWTFMLRQYNHRFKTKWCLRDLDERGILDLKSSRSLPQMSASEFNRIMPFVIDISRAVGPTPLGEDTWLLLAMCHALSPE